MDEATERAMIAEVTRTIEDAEGAPPQGWLGPWISESHVTPDLLAEAGYRYCLDWAMDDQPVWLATRDGGRILSDPLSAGDQRYSCGDGSRHERAGLLCDARRSFRGNAGPIR